MERRLAGPGDLVREALVGGLAGATPVGRADFKVQKTWAWDGAEAWSSWEAGVGVGGEWMGEAHVHLVGPGPLTRPSLAVALGAQVPWVWGPPQGWDCTRSRRRAPHCQVPQAPKWPPPVAWPHPAPNDGCWVPDSAGRHPLQDCVMPQGWGAPLFQAGTFQGPGALALEGWGPGAGLGGLEESKGVRPSPLPPRSPSPGPSPSRRWCLFGMGSCQFRAHLILVPAVLTPNVPNP